MDRTALPFPNALPQLRQLPGHPMTRTLSISGLVGQLPSPSRQDAILPCRESKTATRQSKIALALFCFALLACRAGPLLAERPRVRFDVPHMVACRDVTTAEFAAAHPGDRLLEAQFELSTMLVAGAEEDLAQYVYRITSPQRSLQVVDYQPKTTLASDYAGNIGVEKKRETTKSAGLAITGSWEHLLKVTGSGELGAKNSSAVRYEMLAPLEPLAASGTIHRGHGAYFKLKPSRQTSLEGSKSFTLLFRAPASWRGDYLQIHCEASGVRRGVVRPLDEEVRCGVRDFFVAVYLPADQEAKAAAQRLVHREGILQKRLWSYHDQIAAASRRNVMKSLVSIFEPSEAESARLSLERLLYSHEDQGAESIPESLPEPVRAAVADYLAAREAMRDLNGMRETR